MKRRAKVDYARWVFVLPALLVVGILLIYPIFSSLYYSMTTKHLIRLTYDFIGLENYKAVLADPNFFKAFLNGIQNCWLGKHKNRTYYCVSII